MSGVYRNFQKINSLSTPCGEITVTDENGNKLIFSAEPNDCSDYHLFAGTDKEELLTPDGSYYICIDIKNLEIGRLYKIRISSCRLNYGDSDEHTEAVSGTVNGYSIAIGSYDPNDEEKIEQAYEYSRKNGFFGKNIILNPPEFDESNFSEYDVEMLDDYSGFQFRLLNDNTRKEISFKTAWVKNKYEDHMEYEDAVEFWTL